MERNLSQSSMMNKTTYLSKNMINCLLITVLSLLSVYLGLKNFLLFHVLVEFASVIVAVIILIITLNTHHLTKSSFFLFLGISYGFVGAFDLGHAFAYKGMGIFEGNTSDLATQLWIAARYLESTALLLSIYNIKRKISLRKITMGYFVVSSALVLSIAYFGIFPKCFIDGQGLTPFKIISEYIIIGILSLSAYVLFKTRDGFDKAVYSSFFHAIIITVLSEVFFTLYTDVYGIQNMIGHILKLISFYIIYKGVVATGFKQPYKLLYSKIEKQNEELNIREAEIKQVENLLLQNEEGYKMLIELSEYSVLAHSEGKIIFANKNAAKLGEVDNPEDMKGMDVFQFIHRDYYDIIVKRQKSILEDKESPCPLEFKIVGLNGREAYVESMASRFAYMGKPAVLIVLRDISDRKRLEEVLEQDKMKTEAFANISHDLKTPINVFFASLQLMEFYLRNGEVEKDMDKVYGHIKTMKQNSYRVIKLVNNLVDMTKIGSGYMKLNLCNLNIVSVIEDIVMSVAEYMENKGIHLIFDTEIEEKITAVDPDKIERIMLNLLSNAIKFTNPGGSIKVDIYDIGDGVIISVKDTGTGIPEDKLLGIFDRFKQVEETLVRNGQGSGIGLSLVKSLVEMHGGIIKAISQWGVGTEFIIELPVELVSEDDPMVEADVMQKNNVERIKIEFSDIYLQG